MKKFYILLFSFSILFVHAQDLVFLNSNQSLINLNPSFAGSNGFVRNQSSLRIPAPKNSYRSYSVGNSFDMYLSKIKGGFAFSLLEHAFLNRSSTTNIASLSYAQYLNFLNAKLKVIPSVQASYGVMRYTPLTWGSEISEPVKLEQIRIDGGLLINYKDKLYTGAVVSGRNFTENTSIVPRLFIIHASYNANVHENTMLQFFVSYSEGVWYKGGRVGVHAILFKNYILGGQYLHFSNAPVFSLGYRKNFFSILASYDFRLNRRPSGVNSYAEIHFSYSLRNKENRHPSSLLSFESW